MKKNILSILIGVGLIVASFIVHNLKLQLFLIVVLPLAFVGSAYLCFGLTHCNSLQEKQKIVISIMNTLLLFVLLFIVFIFGQNWQ